MHIHVVLFVLGLFYGPGKIIVVSQLLTTISIREKDEDTTTGEASFAGCWEKLGQVPLNGPWSRSHVKQIDASLMGVSGWRGGLQGDCGWL